VFSYPRSGGASLAESGRIGTWRRYESEWQLEGRKGSRVSIGCLYLRDLEAGRLASSDQSGNSDGVGDDLQGRTG
jgi:hypothetical protein